ncbi:MAG: amidohydrolase family protein, partial [Oscillospiraceae bacterium]
MKKLLIINASELVTVDGTEAKKGKDMNQLSIIENGACYCLDGIISDVGTTEEILKRHGTEDCEIFDASGKAVLPGFIDSHTHLTFGGYRADEFNW